MLIIASGPTVKPVAAENKSVHRQIGRPSMPLPLDRLKGSIPPLLTPFRNGEVDYDAYARLVEMQIREGSHGILVNGTTSEPASLTTEERNRLVTLAVEVAKGRVPIVAATGSQSIWETRILTEHAAKAGADALLIVTPYYTRPPQRGMVAYYLEVMKGIDLPWMIYHIPGRAAIDIKIDTVKELQDKSPNFVGMKHASLDLDFVTECLAAAGPRLQDLRRSRGFVVPDDGDRRLRADECGRQSAPARARPICARRCGAAI